MILPSRSLFPTSNTTAMLVYTNCGPQGTPLVRLLLLCLVTTLLIYITHTWSPRMQQSPNFMECT